MKDWLLNSVLVDLVNDCVETAIFLITEISSMETTDLLGLEILLLYRTIHVLAIPKS